MKTKIAHFLLHLLEEAPFGSTREAAALQPGGYSLQSSVKHEQDTP